MNKKTFLSILLASFVLALIFFSNSIARINNPTDTSSFQATITALNPLTLLSGVLSMPTSTISQDGFLKGTDFTKFNTRDIAFNVVNATSTPTATTTIQRIFYQAITITDISCSTNGANITIGADERTASTPDTLGTDVFNGGTLVCDSNENSTSTFANATIGANALLNFDLDSLANSTTTLRVGIKYTLD